MSHEPDLEQATGHDDWRRVALKPSHDSSELAGLLRHRRSTKSYQRTNLDLRTLGRLLSTTLGAGLEVRRPYGSAHARYDIAVTAVIGAVTGLAPAAYRYLPTEHALACVEVGDHRSRLAGTTLDADWLTDCPAVLLLSADITAANRVFEAQGSGQGERFCWLEAGLIAQNIYLWCAENALGSVFIGGLDSRKVREVAERLTPPSHTVLGLLPVGHPVAKD